MNNELLNEKKEHSAKYQSNISEKEKQFIQSKAEFKDYKEEIDKLKHQLNERNDYISKLPTIDEFEQLQVNVSLIFITFNPYLTYIKYIYDWLSKIKNSESEKEDLMSKIENLEKKVHRAKILIKEQVIKLEKRKSLFNNSQFIFKLFKP